MGCDKALLELGGSPLVAIALDKLRALGFSPRIVGSRSDLARFAPVIYDRHSHNGPLGGIEAALVASDADQNLFLPIDMPWLPTEFLLWMADRAQETRPMATIPRCQGCPQPVCAIYSAAILPHIQAALAAGSTKVMHAVHGAAGTTGLRIDSFDVEIIAAAQSWEQPVPLHVWFENINTPADFQKASLEQLTRIH
jgi:molybdopterin-guanine dinucleotide biosynthesis protein A